MKAMDTTVLRFIGGLDKSFIVPPFQRNYAWGEKECIELFDDIVESCRTGKTHYLGNITYYEGDNNGASHTEIVLVDGQQRVTTVLILLCAIRDLINDSAKKDNINRRYLLNDSDEDIYRIRLKQTKYDSNSFTSIIDNKIPDDSSNNVIKNYNLFKKMIKEKEFEPIQIYEAIQNLEVVEVNLLQGINLGASDKLETVQKVFEKINSTGKPLTPADLIRNLLLLVHSASEQIKLYDKYWIKIENTLQGEHISRFARDFIIMKTFNDVPERQIYSLFKEYFYNETRAKNERVLDEMYKYSKFYTWIRVEACPDKNINRSIKMLNILKTDDCYPLYLYLLASMYENQKEELRKIFILLTDYLLRYRIVTPSGGGGALRSFLQEILEKLVDESINFTRDDIYYELSNSPTLAGRFPDDEEFKKHLISNVNPSYAKVLLLKIEENETRNIPVDISEVTVEHLMPQTLTDWWKSNLRGEAEAERIYSEYINCIGNLTLVSKSYNSAMSNKPWGDKLECLKDVQFIVTSKIADEYTHWTKESIIKRSNIMADRAISAITSPLERKRPFRTKNNADDYTPGIYQLSDIASLMNGSVPVNVIIDDYVNPIACRRWKDLLSIVCFDLLKRDAQLFKSTVANNLIHKATSRKNYPQKDPIISMNPNHLLKPLRINDSDYYCESNLSNISARIYAKRLLEIFNCADKFSIEIS
ncbi:MAG: DUF262 domain-containing HNH endonuclease family protein [Helicobacteraceae bacterium]|jgi:uncharacterized protein with ParB-like and HNH nuclease domain|nr:DUF262 domain-containing HNH endonuclease family protein [Helicobacteraceae bacterium]